MYTNTQTIKTELKKLIQNGGAVIFSIQDYYVQFIAEESPDEIYFKAVSHNYLDTVQQTFLPAFIAMGFGIEEGGNYNKTVLITSEQDYDKIALECERIFTEFYGMDYHTPVAFQEID